MKSTKTKVAIYVRVASHNDQKKKATKQEEQLRLFASNCGYTVDEKHVYKEMGYSGLMSVDERPQLKKLVEDAESGNIKAVLIRDISRLFRDTRLLLNFLAEVDRLGIRIITMMGGYFDTSVPYDRIVITLVSSMSELESRYRSELAIKAINKKKNGTDDKKANESRLIHSRVDRRASKGVRTHGARGKA